MFYLPGICLEEDGEGIVEEEEEEEEELEEDEAAAESSIGFTVMFSSSILLGLASIGPL